MIMINSNIRSSEFCFLLADYYLLLMSNHIDFSSTHLPVRNCQYCYPSFSEEESSHLSTDLKKQSKQASRRSYINRVKEITKNSRKQDADIDQILKETRELQLESNNIRERLNRTYAVVDELVLRYAPQSK